MTDDRKPYPLDEILHAIIELKMSIVDDCPTRLREVAVV